MGLFSKKKEQPMSMMPKPTAPFIPSQPSQRPSLKDQLGMNQDKSASWTPASTLSAGLPPIPEDISKDVGSVAKRVSAMSDKVSKLESELPPLPDENAPEQAQPEAASTQQPTASQSGAKVFVRLDKYSDILKTINNMESKINELQNALGKISSIKESEQEIISSWTSLINEARDRVAEVNSKLPPLNR
jgi:hypothetical protein